MSSTAHVTANATDSRAAFIRARLGSLLAFAPLGVWTFFHLWDNLSAFRGADAWQSAVTGYSSPLAQVVTGMIALVPLAVHTVWGVGRLFSSRPNNARYPFYTNLKYAIQRLSAVGLLLFLGAHLWLAFIRPRVVLGRAEPFADIAHEMHHHMPTLIVYVLGTLGVAYHLANGMQTFAMGWGIVTTQRALKRLERAVLLMFALLLVMGWGAIYALWTAGSALPN